MRPTPNLTSERRLQRIVISVKKIENLLSILGRLRKRISFQDSFSSSLDLRISKLLRLRNALIDIVSSNCQNHKALFMDHLGKSPKAIAKQNLIDFQSIKGLKRDVKEIDKNLCIELCDLKANAQGFSNLTFSINTFLHFINHIKEVNKRDLHPINMNRIAYNLPKLRGY